MTDLQKQYLKMFRMIWKAMNDAYPTWENNNMIVMCMDELKNYIDEISKYKRITTPPKFQINKVARMHRKQLTHDAFVVKEALRLYYDYNNFEEEKNLFSFPVSHFVNLRNNDFYLLCREIADKANALISELAILKITQQQILNLRNNVDEYYEYLQKIEKLNETYKGATADVAVLINDCRLMLRDRLDRLMVIYGTGYEDEYRYYRNLRKIQHKGGPKNYYTVIVSGKITLAKLRTPLSGVKVIPETKGKSSISDEEGLFTVKLYKKDARALNFELDGYEPARYTFPEVIKEHKMAIGVQMKKIKELPPMGE
jgi:hypothetical protein